MQRAKKAFVVLCAVLLIGSLAAAGTVVAGTWYSATVGHLDYYNIANGDLDNGGVSTGYGMALWLKTNRQVSLNYSIPGSTYDWPVFFQHKVRWVRVNAMLYSADVRVVGVQVYDGDTLLGGVSWGWDGGWRNAYHDIYVDLGSDKAITKGLRVAVWIQSGGDAADYHHVDIHSVSARVD